MCREREKGRGDDQSLDDSYFSERNSLAWPVSERRLLPPPCHFTPPPPPAREGITHPPRSSSRQPHAAPPLYCVGVTVTDACATDTHRVERPPAPPPHVPRGLQCPQVRGRGVAGRGRAVSGRSPPQCLGPSRSHRPEVQVPSEPWAAHRKYTEDRSLDGAPIGIC